MYERESKITREGGGKGSMQTRKGEGDAERREEPRPREHGRL
jgi:hypothetical protein